MNELLRMCLVVCPLIFLAGFVDSVAGGGGLISLPAYLFVGIPVHLASGTNKVVNSTGTAVAAWRYFRSGKVDLRAAVWAAGGALAGAAVGARLALWFSERMLQTCVLVALPVVAVILVVKKDFGRETAEKDWTVRQIHLLSVVIGVVTGMYDGMIGPGTGTFMIMAFTLVLGMDLLMASGCAKVANLASNIASAVVWIIGGKVMWTLVLPAVVCSILGSICGTRFAIRGGSQKVRGMIFVVLGLLFAKMIWELLT
ncbi:sulfite exporter TauE/SafE family protein [Dysosmobacter sp. HCP28S3_G4]|uniref:sulfite exporter TauE/SafE family protein n=1 Tax=Dysosmobacter sp. HCP28S3_G4 TaxID=3438938 RepID=UPI003F02154E|nr:sulfite exporter TauE/SafE family protein [Dysosmobacter sp.]